jgi:YVTN family beta-propeller protein
MLLGLGGSPVTHADTPAPLATQLRRPVALALADDGRWLFVANHRAGTISVLDTAGLRVTAEVAVGRRLSDLALTPDGLSLLALDEDANQLVRLTRQGHRLEVRDRLPVAAAPVSLLVAGDGTRGFVASLWSRRLTVVDLTRPAVVKTLDLPFAPRRQLLVRGDAKLLVADAFGGRLAVVDTQRAEIDCVRTLPAHNIRGLAVSADGDRLLVTHQVLNGLAQTTFDDVHWGNLLTNNLRSLPLAAVLAPDADPLRDGQLHLLGDVGRAAGDPAGIAVAADGQVVVAFAGVNEVALGREADTRWQRLAVGRRPTAVLLDPDGKRAYAASTFGDSVAVVDLAEGKLRAEIALGPQPELSRADQGELLFHDARLAHDGWFSCHSCHTDGHTNGQLADTLGDDSFGAPKRVLSLRGVGDTGPWNWNGRAGDLGGLVRKSIRTTLQGRAPARKEVEALTAYLQTLPPAPAVARLRGPADEDAVHRGRAVFEKQGCTSCHVPPAYTSRKAYDVGLADEVGNREFNPPSLRGVSQGGPYLHDGRAATLEEVFARHRHQLKAELAKNDLSDLLRFLRTL